MDGPRAVACLDVHKDCVYLCSMQDGEGIIFEKPMEGSRRNSVRNVMTYLTALC